MPVIYSANHPPGTQRGTATRRFPPLPCGGEPLEDLWSPLLCIHWSTNRHSAKGLVPSQTGMLNSLLFSGAVFPISSTFLDLMYNVYLFCSLLLCPSFYSLTSLPPPFFSSFPPSVPPSFISSFQLFFLKNKYPRARKLTMTTHPSPARGEKGPPEKVMPRVSQAG